MIPINQNMVRTSYTENPSNKTSNVKEVKFSKMFNRIHSKNHYIEAMQRQFESISEVIAKDPISYTHYNNFIKSERDNMSEADKHKAFEAYQCYIKNNRWK